MLTPGLCCAARALAGSTNADTSNHTLEAGDYVKMTARGWGQHQPFDTDHGHSVKPPRGSSGPMR